jgi:hypothetical protein
MGVLVIMALNIAGKEGLTGIMNNDSKVYLTLKTLGLTKNLSLIAIFTLSHFNQSKYIGISKADSIQYMTIRVLPYVLLLLIVVRSDYIGNLKHHFE